jgi:hypothetical protein
MDRDVHFPGVMTHDPFSERAATFSANRHVNVVVETPTGSAAKYTRREGRMFELLHTHDHSSALALVEAAR